MAEANDACYNSLKGNFNDRIKKMYQSNWKSENYRFLVKANEYGANIGWFDSEFKDNFGLNIFEKPFDKEKGFQTYYKDNIHVFIYQLEKLNSLEEELRVFLENPNFKLIRANDAREKDIKYIYDAVKERVVISKELLDFFYEDNEKIDYFYTKEDQMKFRKKWEGRNDEPN